MASVLAPGQVVGRLFEEAEIGGALALEPITELVNGSYALLFRTSTRGADVEEAFCHGVDVGYVNRLKEAAQDKFLPGWLSGLKPGTVFDRATFGSDQQFARTTFYNHVIRPEGRFHCIIATPCVTRLHRFHLVVGRPCNRQEFSADKRRLLAAMLPQIGGLLRLRADLADADAAASRLVSVLDHWHSPVLVVTGAARPTLVNEAARRRLVAGDLLRLDAQGRLALSSLMDSERLRRTLRNVARDGGEQSLSLDGIANGVEGRLTVKRISAVHGEPLDDVELLIQVETAEVEDTVDERVCVIARQYGLTRREVAVLAQLARGDALKTAARELGVSYNTSRTYLRQIFEKTRLHRQSDLIRLCMTGSLPGQNVV